MNESSRRGALAGALAFAALLFFSNLGSGSLWDNSEPNYGEIVKELLRTRDWLTLHFDGAPWFVHPPLWFWSAGASASLLGLNEFALRLPSAACGLLLALVAYLATRRMYGHSAGMLATLALASSLEIVVLSRLAILDTMLVCAMTATTFWGYFAIRDGDRHAWWIAVVAAALGTLVKGPVAAVVPALVLVVFALWQRAPIDNLRRLPLLAGCAAYAVLAGWWFALEARANGAGYLAFYFLHANVGRALAPFENQPGPIYYYLPVIVAGFFPFIVLVPWAVWRAWRERAGCERFLLAAAAVPFVFFSLLQTKQPNYVAVSLPPLAALIGGAFAATRGKNLERPLRFGLFAAAALVAGCLAYAPHLRHTPYAALTESVMGMLAVMAALPIVALATLAFAQRASIWLAPLALCAMTLAFVAFAAFAILPRVEAFKPMRAMAATVMSVYRPGERLGAYEVSGEYSLAFYTSDGPVTFVGTAPGDVDPAVYFRQPMRALLVTSPMGFERLERSGYRLQVVSRGRTLLLATQR